MFKKSLLALALASVALTANAGTVKTSISTASKNVPFAVSNQGLPLTGEYVIASTASGSTIDVNFSKAEKLALKDGNFLAITVAGAFFADYTVSGTAYVAEAAVIGPANGITLKHIKAASTRKNSATKLYLETTGTAGDAATLFSIDDLNLQVISGASEITFTIAIENESGIEVTGTKSAATAVATLQDQWAVALKPKLDSQIDVAAGRKQFVADGSNVTTDTLKLDHVLNGSGTNVVPDSYKVTVKGDFTGIASVVATTAGAFAINTAKTEASKTITLGSAEAIPDDTLTFTLTSGTAAVAQTERNFTADIEVTYSTSKTLLIANNAAAGGFTLNSTSATLNFVPFGPNTQLILNATSTFSEAASVDVTYVKADGTTDTLTDIGSVAPNSVTKLGDIITAAIIADDGEASGKTKITVSVNAPTGKVTYFSGFKVTTDGGRMALEQVTTTEGDAADIKADLANTVDGLSQISGAVAAVGDAGKLSTAKSAVSAILTTGDSAAYSASGNLFDGASILVNLDAICALANAGSTTYAMAVTGSDTAADIVLATTLLATHTCSTNGTAGN